MQRGDIVTAINSVPVSNAGTVPFTAQRKGERIDLSYLITSLFTNDTLSVSFFRDGIRHSNVEYKLSAMGSSRLVPNVDTPRQYILHGGLVFLALSEAYLRAEFNGDQWMYEAPVSLINAYFYGRKAGDGRTEVVVLAHVLNSQSNAGYEDTRASSLHKINGRRVNSLAHVAELLDEFDLDNEVKWLRFELDYEELIIIDKRVAQDEMSSVLSTHSIPAARCLP
jgi:hypothetical protein